MKSLERVVSEKAIKLGNSFPCQICVIGFLCGVCLTSLFLTLLTSLSTFNLTLLSFPSSSLNSTSQIIKNMAANTDHKLNLDDQVTLLVTAWGKLLKDDEEEEDKKSEIPKAPHLENCKEKTEIRECLDTRIRNEKFPPWSTWKGKLDKLNKHKSSLESEAYPPWINGGDEENYPLTRRVQSDIWIHQHPLNCSDPNVKFLVADWEHLPGFGIGAQIAGMIGLLGIAVKENRVLVTNHYNRADHDGCKGSSRASWSCYFLPETSHECRQRAFELMRKREAWEIGVITGKHNYSSKEIWSGNTPKLWGKPWSYMQPTTEINGSFIRIHKKMDRRWWRAQAVRYLMRFPTEYTCNLMNIARHSAFAKEAAKIVLSRDNRNRLKDTKEKKTKSEIEEYVWSDHKPWIPRPLLSVHVRMGDKACEMNIVSLEEYMRLADRIRDRFPELNSIWLSTEMAEVVNKTKEYETYWRFYYTEVKRQVGNKSMADYEASLGREMSTNYPLVNFLMASDADFFIGALGSTWCFLIDGMRNTGGKVMSGYLSVNKDRFW